ncbi:hypothetical protein VPNG_10048 [Cytospora leucostoma]|uniref:Uncharacterized protein n=1 Tax=Cytospora leucostoma TaxID=1230097 RepID=A0A423VHY6_9PEZI|nr:hypothetical protein VPNG_10048 [Cytospora leucostoma]
MATKVYLVFTSVGVWRAKERQANDQYATSLKRTSTGNGYQGITTGTAEDGLSILSLEPSSPGPARLTAGVLLLSLSFGGVRFGGLALDLDSISCAGLSFAFAFLLEDDLADAGRDVRFGGLGLSLSFSFDRVRLGGLVLGPVCCMDDDPELVFVLLIGGERADIDDLEFDREGGGETAVQM